MNVTNMDKLKSKQEIQEINMDERIQDIMKNTPCNFYFNNLFIKKEKLSSSRYQFA